jgi:GrpB-like predicted nucleotidyltransferase (UPF0157 family)
MRDDPIVIVPYDEDWPSRFEAERDRLTRVLGPLLTGPIEHIGSTAVPGLAAKPIVDLLAVVREIDAVDQAAAGLPDVGWLAAPESNDAAHRRRSFCSPTVERRTAHLHVVEASSSGWRGWLAFRDHLRVHPEAAREYEALKRALAAELGADPNERDAYRSGKAAFIGAVTEEALAARD